MAEPPAKSSCSDKTKARIEADDKLKVPSTSKHKTDAALKEPEPLGAVKEAIPKTPANKTSEVARKEETVNLTTEPSRVSSSLEKETKQDPRKIKKETSSPTEKPEPGETQEAPGACVPVPDDLSKPTLAPPRSSTSESIPPATTSKVSIPALNNSSKLQTTKPSGGDATRDVVLEPSKDAIPKVVSRPAAKPAASAKSTEPAGGAPSGKKRKLSSTGGVGASNTNVGQTTNAARPTATTTPSLADFPAVSQMVQNMFTLLETYGPLTQAQLEYNLPPLQGGRLSQKHFRDILEVLVATGIVQKEDMASTTGKSETQGSSVPQKTPVQQQQPPRYCVLSGITRQVPTTPTKVLQEIRETQDEWRTSLLRQAKLKAALLNPSVQPREVLKQLLVESPEIASDPVYVAALRNLHVDAGLAFDHKSGGSRPKGGGKGGAKRAPKKRKAPAPASASGNQQKSMKTTLSSTPTSTAVIANVQTKATASTPASTTSTTVATAQQHASTVLVVEAELPTSTEVGATAIKTVTTATKPAATTTKPAAVTSTTDQMTT